MDQSPENAPLARGSLSGSDDALVLGARPGGGSNKRAFKVAGLTTLACLLLASQVFTAYMVFGQKDQIHALQKSSEQMSRELRSPSRGGSPMRMQLPMKSLPLLRTFDPDEDHKTTKTPMTELQDTAISVEKQVKDLLQDSPLPQFNETFLANLQSLKQHMNETEWQSFETWMRYWLIFQMAQHQPAPPTSIPVSVTQTKCQIETAPGYSKIGSFKPQCDEQGRYLPMQCWSATGFCWCVDESGTEIPGTAMRGRPDCQRGAAPRQMVFAPRLMQRTLSVQDEK